MLDSSIINGRTARTTFFIMFVGGLYFLSSYLLSLLCNKLIFGVIQIPCINTLESSGIIAFLFIIFFGIKFGLKYNDNRTLNNPNNKPNNQYNYSSIQNNSTVAQTNLSYKTNLNNFEFEKNEENSDLSPNIYTAENNTKNIKQSITKSNINKIENQINNQINIAKNKIKLTKENSNCLKKIEQMTDEQKKQLQLTLAKSCGIQINDEKKFV